MIAGQYKFSSTSSSSESGHRTPRMGVMTQQPSSYFARYTFPVTNTYIKRNVYNLSDKDVGNRFLDVVLHFRVSTKVVLHYIIAYFHFRLQTTRPPEYFIVSLTRELPSSLYS